MRWWLFTTSSSWKIKGMPPLKQLSLALQPVYGLRAPKFAESLFEKKFPSLKASTSTLPLSCQEGWEELLGAIQAHTPVEYLLGEVTFLGACIHVDQRALIPRVETEILADLLVKKLKKTSRPGQTLLDLCTGSACLAIALKKHLPHLNVLASDICPLALNLAKENARRNQVEIEFFQGDALTPFFGTSLDYLVANPPYLSECEYAQAQPSVKHHEPLLALTSGYEGMDCMYKIKDQCVNKVIVRKGLYMEIGAQQGEKVKSLFENQGKILRDWSGKDRFFFLERE